MLNGSPGNRIEGNIISGNTHHGVEIRNPGASGNVLVGNLIGVSVLMGILVGNDGHGVLIDASDNVIGGTNTSDANVIAGNFGAGISISSGRRNKLSRNAIYSNFGLGIDLAPGGLNSNDALDVDIGANDMQNYPVLDSLKRRGSSTDVYGRLVTAPNGLYTVEFFADSGDISRYGQGHRYLGSFTTPTGQSGTARFSVTLPEGVSSREVLTATVTDADGNTSEFSRGIGRDYKITNPPRGKLWVVGEVDTIRWEVADTGHVRIEFSSDSGFTYHTITADTNGAAREFPWTVEKVRSTRCRIRVSSVEEPSSNGESEYFKVKGVELTRYTADSSYEAFDPAVHGWSFRNDPSVMWSEVWYNHFNYANGIDPVTRQQYPAAWSAAPINANSSDFPDWQLFISAFGVDQCYFSSSTGLNYRREAVDFWSAMKGGFKGSCYGFAVSSLMAFDAPRAFMINEPEMPPFVELYPLVANTAHHLQNTVNKLWVYTVGRINKIQSDTHASDHLSDVLDALREDYLSDTRDDRIISFWAAGGHSLAPYKIEKDSAQPNIRYLYLYDSNNPGARDTRVVMDIGNDTWTYAPLGWANTNHFVISEPVSTNFPPALIPKVGHPIQSRPFAVSGLKDQIEVYSPAGTSVSITSNSGGRIRYADSVTVDSIPGAHVIIPPTGGPHPPIGCSLSSRYVCFGSQAIPGYHRAIVLLF